MNDRELLDLAVTLAKTNREYAELMCAAINKALMCDYENKDHTSAVIRRAIVRAAAEIGKEMP